MRDLWFRVWSYFRTYRAMYARGLSRMYTVGLVLVVGLIFLIPITLGLLNPDVRLPDTHGGPPAALMREWNHMVTLARREQSRMNDFTLMVQRMSENYPFFALSERHTGIHYIELAVLVFDELIEEGLHDIRQNFVMNFFNERFLALLGGYGRPRVTAQMGYAELNWLNQPYFFGLYDWRFADERFDVPVRDDNVQVEMTDAGVAVVRIGSFLHRGNERITRLPFYYFDWEAERQFLLDVFERLDSSTDLVIDIRGLGSGFGDYFVPLLLAPLLDEAVGGRFYAFHSEGFKANQVSEFYRAWYGLGETVDAYMLQQHFEYEVSPSLTRGFVIDRHVAPVSAGAFDGTVWLLTDSDNFSGPNFMYLQLAREAGFRIVYEENTDAAGWATSYVHLPHNRLVLRFNPLYFTDVRGRSLEAGGAFYDMRKDEWLIVMGDSLE